MNYNKALILLSLTLFPLSSFADQKLDTVEFKALYSAAKEKKEVLIEKDSSSQVMVLPNAKVSARGVVITEKNQLVTYRNKTFKEKLFGKRENSKQSNHLLEFKGAVASVSTRGDGLNSWLLGVIPKIIILKEASLPFDKIYLNNPHFAWQKNALNATLSYVGFSRDKLLLIGGDEIVKANKVLVSSIDKEHLPEWVYKKLADIFLKANESKIEVKDKIFLARSLKKSKSLGYEKALATELEKKGFEVVVLDRLSVADRAKIFSKAKIIVSSHHDELAAMVFANPGLKVIEIGFERKKNEYEAIIKRNKINYSLYPLSRDKKDDKKLALDIQKIVSAL